MGFLHGMWRFSQGVVYLTVPTIVWKTPWRDCQRFSAWMGANRKDRIWLYRFCGIQEREMNFQGIDTRDVVTMRGLFADAAHLRHVDLSGLHTEQVTDMRDMFSECRRLVSLDLTSFNTGMTRQMDSMFRGCQLLRSADISSFDTSLVENMEFMFAGCSSLISLGEDTVIDMSSVKRYFMMFWQCEYLRRVKLRNVPVDFSYKQAGLRKDQFIIVDEEKTTIRIAFSVQKEKWKAEQREKMLAVYRKAYLEEDGSVDEYSVFSATGDNKKNHVQLDLDIFFSDPVFREAFKEGIGFISHGEEYLDNIQTDRHGNVRCRQFWCGNQVVRWPKERWSSEYLSDFQMSLFEIGHFDRKFQRSILEYVNDVAMYTHDDWKKTKRMGKKVWQVGTGKIKTTTYQPHAIDPHIKEENYLLLDCEMFDIEEHK